MNWLGSIHPGADTSRDFGRRSSASSDGRGEPFVDDASGLELERLEHATIVTWGEAGKTLEQSSKERTVQVTYFSADVIDGTIRVFQH